LKRQAEWSQLLQAADRALRAKGHFLFDAAAASQGVPSTSFAAKADALFPDRATASLFEYSAPMGLTEAEGKDLLLLFAYLQTWNDFADAYRRVANLLTPGASEGTDHTRSEGVAAIVQALNVDSSAAVFHDVDGKGTTWISVRKFVGNHGDFGTGPPDFLARDVNYYHTPLFASFERAWFVHPRVRHDALAAGASSAHNTGVLLATASAEKALDAIRVAFKEARVRLGNGQDVPVRRALEQPMLAVLRFLDVTYDANGALRMAHRVDGADPTGCPPGQYRVYELVKPDGSADVITGPPALLAFLRMAVARYKLANVRTRCALGAPDTKEVRGLVHIATR
jgi:hypothetical protein